MSQPSVFISYSHKDEEWKDRLVQHLRVLADEQGFDVWDDRRIEAGADWKTEIERAILSADVAVMLVSVDFLTSAFIKGKEIPPLLRLREERQLEVLPIIVGDCPWRHVGWLSAMNARPKDGQSLEGMNKAASNTALARIAEELAGKLARVAERRARAAAVPVPPPVEPPRPAPIAPTPAPAPEALPDPPRPRPVAAPVEQPVEPLPPGAEDGVVWPEGVARTPLEFETVTVDERGAIVSRHKRTAPAFTEWLDGVALEMVAIPGGTFVMGSPADEADRAGAEGPQRTVTVAPFFMGKFEVTQAQWRVVARWPQVARALKAEPAYFKGADLPVEQVSWHDAVEFCARLSQRTGRAYRLPSEAEWEYAARAGATTQFHVGPTITPDLVNYDGNHPYPEAAKGASRECTMLAGSLEATNSFGLSDVHGNVWEWVLDPWHASYAGAPSDESVWQAGGDGDRRVVRGGSWNSFAWHCRSASRRHNDSDSRDDDVGFRVLCSVARTR